MWRYLTLDSGITKVFIPQENLYDLKDVAQEVKDRIEIVPVVRLSELLEAAGVLLPAE